ncbi:GIY-YIG nuclease family protein [Methyloceanibacter caenitepidi]|uniref:GIY-YIG nuclease family protein n=1 Tax=Methyloceanibacter caenitepidi TaxID=1384459 RepID=UPI0005EF79CA|nr:GIY-YIG nuclease family protein [Methyloceanibacter caenitepidi]
MRLTLKNRDTKIGNLYFLQVTPFGPVKIGWTSGVVYYRMKQLQYASPHELKWLGAKEATQRAEESAHKLLAEYCIRSEWFHPTPEVMNFITETVGDFDEAAYVEHHFPKSLCDAVGSFRSEHGWDRLVKATGLTSYDIWKWRDRRRVLPQETLAVIADVLSAESST